MAKKIKIFKIRVLIAVSVIVLLSGSLITFYSYRLTNILLKSNIESGLDIYTGRILTEIDHLEITIETVVQIMNDEHISIAKAIDYILKDASEDELTPEALQRLAEPLNIIELNIVNSDGILTHSNLPELIGFNYNDYEETRIYITLTTGTLTEIREEPRQSVLDDDSYGDTNHYAGISRTGGGFIQLGFDADIIWKLYDEFDTAQSVREVSLGDGGFGIVVTDGIITAHPDSAMLGKIVTHEPWYQAVNSGYGYKWLDIDGIRCYAGYTNERGHTILGLVPEIEFRRESGDLMFRSLILTFIAVAVIIPVTYMLLTGLLRGKSRTKNKTSEQI